MADNETILDELDRLDSVLADTYALSGNIKEALTQALEKNEQLAAENDRLRVRLNELEDKEPALNQTSSMQKLYDDGIHVCHQYYGKRLEPGENCLLCQEVLYR
ncbi:MAG: DNA replication initiation control protein YabA [Streptococcaceae bacterium]|jgi:regulator of replication initiation timing|nr:DNA replication initiation control protein YabA [Streptococcaceae bacterium]